jgi:FtsH-binding integral membrane protein
MDLAQPHTWAGLAIVSLWAVVSGWSFALRLLRYDETPTFWRVVSVAQILLGIQLLLGLVLLVLGRRPGDGSWFDFIFHLLYGIVFPLLTLFFAHKWAREKRFDAHAAFAVAGLVIFGLTARAFMVGAGIG